MKTYLLPCKCGQRLEVDSSQAGLPIACSCGATIDVPTMRGLSQLETLDSDAATGEAREASAWGPAQGMLFLGTLLLLFGLPATWYVYSGRPDMMVDKNMIRAHTDHITGEQSYELWEEFKKGLNRAPTELSEGYANTMRTYHRYLGFAIAPLAIGVLLVVAGGALKLRSVL